MSPDDSVPRGGTMGALIRAHDWDHSPLGPVERWPQSLKTALDIILASSYPMYIAWGPHFTQFYNDAYRPILGATKHPQALGQGTRECFAEIWDFIGPMFEKAMATGEATFLADQLLPLDRYGYPEECYFTFSYSAIPSETGAMGGVFVTVIETTERVLSERRMGALRGLAARAVEAHSTEQALSGIEETLGQNCYDLPFTLLYLTNPDGRSVDLCCTSGVDTVAAGIAQQISLSPNGAPDLWRLGEARASGRALIISGLDSSLGPLSRNPWPEPLREAIVLPIIQPAQEIPAGFLVAGISPRRALNDDYRNFLDLVAGSIARGIGNARAYEEERKRSEALAELDRAKTTFFSNVSHEFRTPLTLMLGTLEDMLASDSGAIPPAEQQQLAVVHRNSLRLLKLVNSLLDFSRIEAGRVQASYEPVDLASFTAELASVFRSAVERAGMKLRIDCAPLSAPVYVDREMWEKVVLNLLSNAFKFTLEGEIEVKLTEADGAAILSVRDTGTGIPLEELPHIFERFHRVEGAHARTHEGTGIGLALVQELVKLHGGSTTVRSVYGEGATFTVRVPLGREHLPPERIGASRTAASTALGADPFVEEALRWLPGEGGTAPTLEQALDAALPEPKAFRSGRNGRVESGRIETIILADDNADMRDYLQRLLASDYEVVAVADGLQALQAVSMRLPDLVITDVMMPVLDGFGLLRALRDNPHTASIPVIMLSARAGEEARVEGLEAGADDYLFKPFSARELLARVSGTLALARTRREALEREQALRAEAESARQRLQASEERYRSLVEATASIVWSTPASGEIEGLQPDWARFTGQSEEETRRFGWLNAIHPEDREHTARAWNESIQRRTPYLVEHRLRRHDGVYRHMLVRGIPILNDDGSVREWFGIHADVSEQRELRDQLETERLRLREIFTEAPAFICTLRGPQHVFETANPAYYQLVGHRDILGKTVLQALPEVMGQGYLELLDNVYSTGEAFIGKELRVLLQRESGAALEECFVDFVYLPLHEADGAISGIFVHGVNVTEQVAARRQIESLAESNRQLYQEARAAQESLRIRAEQLAEADRQKDEFLAMLAHELRNPLAPVLHASTVLQIANAGNPATGRQIEVIERQARHMARLLDDLLDVSRITQGKIELRKSQTDLNTIIEQSIEANRSLLDERSQRLTVSLPPAPLFLDADPVRLQQIVGNLVNNAAKYTEPGGTVLVEAGNREVCRFRRN